MSYMVKNPEDRFSRDEAHMVPYIAHAYYYKAFTDLSSLMRKIFELPHDKTNKMTVRLAKTQISLGICPV